jgi:hypothetical protein
MQLDRTSDGFFFCFQHRCAVTGMQRRPGCHVLSLGEESGGCETTDSGCDP